jgi:hypothetical protein
MRSFVACLLIVVAPVAAASAQGLTGSVGAGAGSARSRSTLGTTTTSFSGAMIGGEGHAGIGRVSVEVAYLQGTLNPDSGSAESRDYVEGDFLLSVVTLPGVTLRVGPHARAYISSGGTQRWLFWTGRVRGERTLIAPGVSGFVEGWLAWSADVNVSEAFDNARGAVVGLSVRLPGAPFYGKLAYGIEQARMGGGARLETVEGLSVIVGFGRR